MVYPILKQGKQPMGRSTENSRRCPYSMEAGRGGDRTSNPQNTATSSSLACSLSVYSNQGHWVIEILCSWHTWKKIIQPPAAVVWILNAEPTLPKQPELHCWLSGAFATSSNHGMYHFCIPIFQLWASTDLTGWDSAKDSHCTTQDSFQRPAS